MIGLFWVAHLWFTIWALVSHTIWPSRLTANCIINIVYLQMKFIHNGVVLCGAFTCQLMKHMHILQINKKNDQGCGIIFWDLLIKNCNYLQSLSLVEYRYNFWHHVCMLYPLQYDFGQWVWCATTKKIFSQD